MKTIKVSCPYCNTENKLTVFQAEKDSEFKVNCSSCGKEFQMDSRGKLIGPGPTPPKKGTPGRHSPAPARAPPPISEREKKEVEKLIEEIKRAEKEAGEVKGAKKEEITKPGKRVGPEEKRKEVVTEEKRKEVVKEEKRKEAVTEEKRKEVVKEEKKAEERKSEIPPWPDRRYPPPRYPPIPPGTTPFPPWAQPQDVPYPNGPPVPGYHPGMPQYPYPYPFPYPKIPFFRNPAWAGKLLILSAVLGVLTAILVFYVFHLSLSGGFDDMTMDGRVTDADGNPVEGAEVRLMKKNITTTTDAEGRFSFRELESGTHTLRIYTQGYRVIYYRFTLMPEGISETDNKKDFTLHKVSGNNTSEEKIDDSIENGIYTFPTFIIICSTISFLGGIAVRKRKYYAFCVLSSIVGIFSFGLGIVSPIFSIVAFVILLRSRYAFPPKNGRVPHVPPRE